MHRSLAVLGWKLPYRELPYNFKYQFLNQRQKLPAFRELDARVYIQIHPVAALISEFSHRDSPPVKEIIS
jgi:hypothetical protein